MSRDTLASRLGLGDADGDGLYQSALTFIILPHVFATSSAFRSLSVMPLFLALTLFPPRSRGRATGVCFPPTDVPARPRYIGPFGCIPDVPPSRQLSDSHVIRWHLPAAASRPSTLRRPASRRPYFCLRDTPCPFLIVAVHGPVHILSSLKRMSYRWKGERTSKAEVSGHRAFVSSITTFINRLSFGVLGY